MRRIDDITDSMDMSFSKLGVCDGQGGLECYSPLGHKELDMTEWLNWTELKKLKVFQSGECFFLPVKDFVAILNADSLP